MAGYRPVHQIRTPAPQDLITPLFVQIRTAAATIESGREALLSRSSSFQHEADALQAAHNSVESLRSQLSGVARTMVLLDHERRAARRALHRISQEGQALQTVAENHKLRALHCEAEVDGLRKTVQGLETDRDTLLEAFHDKFHEIEELRELEHDYHDWMALELSHKSTAEGILADWACAESLLLRDYYGGPSLPPVFHTHSYRAYLQTRRMRQHFFLGQLHWARLCDEFEGSFGRSHPGKDDQRVSALDDLFA